MSQDKKKCAHLPCGCATQDRDTYCCRACRQAAEQEATVAAKCLCGHEHCTAEAISLPQAEALSLATAVLAGV